MHDHTQLEGLVPCLHVAHLSASHARPTQMCELATLASVPRGPVSQKPLDMQNKMAFCRTQRSCPSLQEPRYPDPLHLAARDRYPEPSPSSLLLPSASLPSAPSPGLRADPSFRPFSLALHLLTLPHPPCRGPPRARPPPAGRAAAQAVACSMFPCL